MFYYHAADTKTHRFQVAFPDGDMPDSVGWTEVELKDGQLTLLRAPRNIRDACDTRRGLLAYASGDDKVRTISIYDPKGYWEVKVEDGSYALQSSEQFAEVYEGMEFVFRAKVVKAERWNMSVKGKDEQRA